jgi:hypothetical protein
LLVALAAALVVGIAGPAALGTAPGARGAAADLTLVTDAVYTVRPDAGRVTVSVTIAVRNHTRETRTRRFYFDHAFLAVQPGAANARLTGPRGADVRVAKRTKAATLLRLDFGPRLYSGRTASLRLTFDLPGRGRSASPQVRVGSGLVTLPVWAFASDGARGSSVAVRFPGGWDVAVESGELARRAPAADGGTVLASGPLDRPLGFFAYVTAQRPATFAERPVTLPVGEGEAELVLRGWTDDPAWSRRVGALFGKALPVLRDDIGLAWPIEGPLVIQEAVSRDADAFAGRFDPVEGRLEVAYWADHGVVIHGAAHAWFNGALLADRWANEGFATYYALRAAATLEEAVEPPAMTDAAQAAAQPLNAWAGSTGTRTAADAYAYAASLTLASEIAEAVGPDGLAGVWADAAAGTGAYQPPTGLHPASAAVSDPEGVRGAPDWRGLLDLLEARTDADIAALFRATVVRPEEAGLLDARAAARLSYSRTLALAGDWRLPRAMRDALRGWDFATAETLMADARTVLAQRNALATMAQRGGFRLPDTMRDLFEAGSIAEASARAEAERNAMLAITEALAARSAEDDVLSRIGMIGEHPAADLAAARVSLADGDLDATLVAAGRALRAWTASWEEGRRRALLAIAALATVLVIASATVSHLRRSRRAAGVATTPARGPQARPMIAAAPGASHAPLPRAPGAPAPTSWPDSPPSRSDLPPSRDDGPAPA